MLCSLAITQWNSGACEHGGCPPKLEHSPVGLLALMGSAGAAGAHAPANHFAYPRWKLAVRKAFITRCCVKRNYFTDWKEIAKLGQCKIHCSAFVFVLKTRKLLKPRKANYTLSKWITGVAYKIPTMRMWLSLTNCIFIIIIYLFFRLACSCTMIL